MFRKIMPLLALLALPLLLAACSGVEKEAKYPTGADRAATNGDIYAKEPSIFGKDGLKLFGGKSADEDTGIGVNSYLWRASLDTVSFMPLASADPFGGTILTDWYSAPDAPDERVKVNVLILGKQLRSDGVRVRVFRQVKSGSGWKDAEASAETATQLENAILARARELRVGQM